MAKNNLVLIGFMGTGKTTVGRIASEKLGYKFIDTDDEIQKECRMSVKEIFSTKGEQYFRNMEEMIIEKISAQNKAVIACGGGVVKNPRNIELLKSNGVIICLKADIETIYARIRHGRERPLVRGKSKDDILKLVEGRESLYAVADTFIDTSGDSPLIIAGKMVDAFKMWRKGSAW